MSEKMLFVSGEQEGGHYEARLLEGDRLIIARWEGDSSWTQPGTIISEFCINTGELTSVGDCSDHETVLAGHFIFQFLAETENNWFNSYTPYHGGEAK